MAAALLPQPRRRGGLFCARLPRTVARAAQRQATTWPPRLPARRKKMTWRRGWNCFGRSSHSSPRRTAAKSARAACSPRGRELPRALAPSPWPPATTQLDRARSRARRWRLTSRRKLHHPCPPSIRRPVLRRSPMRQLRRPGTATSSRSTGGGYSWRLTQSSPRATKTKEMARATPRPRASHARRRHQQMPSTRQKTWPARAASTTPRAQLHHRQWQATPEEANSKRVSRLNSPRGQ
mmetsp:Transcript_17617/g.56220  ORF Transcript_17617/g.56220 Transcript_17617/m.56220 type:complete len:237 (-) Transcript_17617:266-976(-)